MQATEHPLNQWGESLHGGLVSKDPAVVAELNGFYNVINEALEEFRSKVREAEKVDQDLKPDRRAERQHKALDEARRELQAKIDNQLQVLGSSTESIRQEIEEASAPTKPDSEIKQLMDFMREQEIRRELQNMERPERGRILLETAGKGDRSILQAAERSLTPLVTSETLDNARNKYTEAVAHEPLQRLQYAEHINQSARATAKKAVSAVTKQIVNLHKDIMSRPAGMEPNSADPALATMSAADKAAFVGRHGSEAFQNIVNGSATVADFEG